ncbi:MAG: O-methyltransferase [Ferruginibacter sp.]
MEIVSLKAEEYSLNFSSNLDKVLQDNMDFTFANHAHAKMHSGHLQGLFLSFISQMIKPSKVLEIGTFTGFSSLCLAKGLKENGILHTIELREESAFIAQRYFNEVNDKRIQLHVGNAIEIIPSINEMWDLVFIDADKLGYIEYYELTLPRIKSGGFIIVDNVLFHGEVLEDNIKGKNAKAIDSFNRHVANDKRVEQVIITLRDGLMLIKKI